MQAIKTLVIIGGISSNSLNQKFFRAIKNLNLSDFEFSNFDIAELPHFNRDHEINPPHPVNEFKSQITEAQALLFITPEYNRSYPGVLKNAIDWGSRPTSDNRWKHKPSAILGATPGSIGTFGAQNHLRQLLSYLDVNLMQQPEIYFAAADKAINDDDIFTNDKTVSLLRDFFSKYHDHIDRIIPHDHTIKTYPSKGMEDSPFAH